MKIAIVGANFSGLGAAWLLHQSGHDIHVYNEPHQTDTGPIAFHAPSSPNMTGLFKALDIATIPYDPSFMPQAHFSWLNRKARRMNRDTKRFQNQVPDYLTLENDEGFHTLGTYLAAHHYSREFIDVYISRMGKTFWSLPLEHMLDFPLYSFVECCLTHQLLQSRYTDWRMVDGSTARALHASMPGTLHTGTPVQVTRHNDHVLVRGDRFDHVIMAMNPDHTLAALTDADAEERDILGVFHAVHGAPIFTARTQAQHPNISTLQARRRTWFCGPWCGHGFDEDGLASALAVAERLAGVRRPWAIKFPSPTEQNTTGF